MLAHRIIAFETQANQATAETSEALPACDRLRPQLSSLMGRGGFHAIYSRALNLAGKEISWLRGVRLDADGSLTDMEGLQQKLDPDDFREGGSVLLAHLLELLVAFIGEPLTFRLVHEAWPRIPLEELESVTGDLR
jgi:hypothetical protein